MAKSATTSASFKWHGAKLIGKVRVDVTRRVNRCAAALQSKIITNISTPTRTQGPSRQSQFPHSDTGKLRQSIVLIPARAEARVIRARVGTPLLYGRFLEVGTRKMLPRPFMRRTLRESLPELRQIFSKGTP